MTAQLSPAPVFRAQDNNNRPLFGGQLFTYAAGTTTPQATYVDFTQTTQNTNPVILNARGECNLWLDPTLSYKFVLEDSSGNQIWIVDNIQGQIGVQSNIVPSADNTWTLGTNTDSFKNLYLGPLHAPALDVSGNIGYWKQTAAEIAAGVTPTSFAYPPGHAWRYGLDPSGAVDIVTSGTLANWLAVIKGGVYGYLPQGTYKAAAGFTISGHTRTRIISDPNAEITTTQSSGFAVTITNCIECDFEFGYLNCGYSGIHMTSTANNVTDTIVSVRNLIGSGRQASKPTDPMANRIGFYIEGPTVGPPADANYYHTVKIKSGFGFDTGIAFVTPASVGGMNSNANTALDCHFEGYWFAYYTNSVENMFIGCKAYNASGTDSSHLAESLRIGDGTYASNFNYAQITTEPGNSNVQGLNCLANSTGNIVILQDNCDHGPTDAGTNNTIISHSSTQWGKTATFEQTVTPQGGLISVPGISASSTAAKNLRGNGGFSSSTTVTITLPNAEPDGNYQVFIMPTGSPGAFLWVSATTSTTFTVSASATCNANFSWLLVR